MRILINDSCVLLNLLAGGCLAAIAADTGWQFAICPAVRDEVKKLRDAETGELVPVDIDPMIASGLLLVLELTGDTEETLYVEHSVDLDDGEAMSIAIAANRRLELAIDDKQAIMRARKAFPELRLWSTPEILKRWSDGARVSAEKMRAIIQLIETRARYFPPRSDPLSEWWFATRTNASTP